MKAPSINALAAALIALAMSLLAVAKIASGMTKTSGVLIAARERYSLLGALVLAALPAVGGGAVRDLLVGREPVAMLGSPLYLSLTAATVFDGFVVMRLPFAPQRS